MSKSQLYYMRDITAIYTIRYIYKKKKIIIMLTSQRVHWFSHVHIKSKNIFLAISNGMRSVDTISIDSIFNCLQFLQG